MGKNWWMTFSLPLFPFKIFPHNTIVHTIQYSGFCCDDYNIAIGSICNIKINDYLYPWHLILHDTDLMGLLVVVYAHVYTKCLLQTRVSPAVYYFFTACRLTTIDGERFTGLNIRGFSAIEVFKEIFSCCLGLKQCISTHYLV